MFDAIRAMCPMYTDADLWGLFIGNLGTFIAYALISRDFLNRGYRPAVERLRGAEVPAPAWVPGFIARRVLEMEREGGGELPI